MTEEPLERAVRRTDPADEPRYSGSGGGRVRSRGVSTGADAPDGGRGAGGATADRDGGAVRARPGHQRGARLRLGAGVGEHRGGPLAAGVGGGGPGPALSWGGGAAAAALVRGGLGVPRLLGAAARARDPAPGGAPADPRRRPLRRLPGGAQGGRSLGAVRAR